MNPFHIFIHLVCVYTYGCMHTATHILEVREQLSEVGSLFPPCGFRGSNSAPQAWFAASTLIH